MTDYLVSRADLMASFQVLQGQFDQQRGNVCAKERAFDQLREDFAGRLQAQSSKLEHIVHPDNPIRALASGLSEQLQKIFDSWERQVAARAKGTRFREGFNDSLLVFIYGKVKSGKSSLGNYMAWGHSQPDDDLKSSSPQPAYFSAERTDVTNGDQEREAERTLQFRVGATEATSSIQGFRLPGLTWIDSPGLHSVNARNGQLAKEYVEHADLILYTMNSQAPGRASDMQEIAGLLSGNKKIMVLLTGSDTTEEDENEQGEIVTTVIMKDPSDRRDQVDYVQAELEQLSSSAEGLLAEILSISTRYAEQNPSPQGISASGMGRLLFELQTLCRSQAMGIKMNAPMVNLCQSIKTTGNDLAGMQEVVSGFARSIAEQDANLQRELGVLGARGASEMRTYINNLFRMDRVTDLEASLRSKAGELIEQLTLEAYTLLGDRQQQDLRRAFDSSRLSGLPEYREITEDREYFAGTQKGTKSWLGLAGAVAGGVVGFFAGGPAGAAVGASLGSSASALGSSASAEYKRHQVVVGDNREEQHQAALDHYVKTFPALLVDHVNALYGPLNTAMQGYCSVLNSDMDELKLSLEQLV